MVLLGQENKYSNVNNFLYGDMNNADKLLNQRRLYLLKVHKPHRLLHSSLLGHTLLILRVLIKAQQNHLEINKSQIIKFA